MVRDKKETISSNVNNNQKAFKAGVWYTISNIAVRAIGIITTPIYTRLLSTTDYGIASTFTSWYSLLSIFFSLDLTMSVGRAKQDYPREFRGYIGSIQLLSGIFSVVCIAIALIFIQPISSLMDLNYTALFVMAVYLLFSSAISFMQARYRYEYQYKQNIFILIYTTLSTAVVSIVLILLFQNDRWLGRILGASLPTVILGVYYWCNGVRKKEIRVNTDYWKYALGISLPILLHTLSINILSQSDRVLITKLIGADATAIYTVAYQYALLINIILNSVNQAWQPWFHDNLFVGNRSLIRDNVKPLTILYAFITVGCVCFAPEAISILGPAEYKSGIWAVAPIAIGVFFQALYSNYINIELHLKKTKYASYGTVIAAITNIVLNVIFIPIYGFIAAAYTTLFSYILLWVIHLFITRCILKVRLYSESFFLLIAFIICVICAIFMFLFDYLLIRFLIMIMIGAAFLFYNRKFLISIYRKKKMK